nr:MAG TPA: DNA TOPOISOMERASE IV, B SUBUNIT [Caudoviricetes sp.]
MAKNIKVQLSEDAMRSIDNYGDSIKRIEDFITAVRTRPGMYIGPRLGPGFLNMFREIFQNSLDQLVRLDSPCNLVKVFYDERDQRVVVSDNGMGIPFDKMIDIYTKSHVSGNFVKKPGEYSAGLNGVGAKVTNALSSRFTATSYHYSGQAKQVIFEQGKLVSDKMIANPEGIQGTIIEFYPDRTIMGDTSLPGNIIYQLVRDMLSLTAIGNTVDFTWIQMNSKEFHELIVNENGIIDNLMVKSGGNLIVPPIVIGYDNGTMKADVAFSFCPTFTQENITGFANMCPTSNASDNTHISGFIDGVSTWFIKYMNKIYLSEKSKIKVNQFDVRMCLVAMVSAFHLEPDFTGQAKEVFSNADYKPFIKQLVLDTLDVWHKSKSQDLQKICKFLKDIAEIRIKSETVKEKVTAKYATSATSGLPAKCVKAVGPASLGWEFLIVEGDSALASARDGRDKMRQWLYPIRGKILSVYNATMEKIMANPELMGIAQILGGGFGKNFDIKKVKFQKLIFFADADADGSHINSLLLLMALVLFPGMVEAGMVYKAVPPLYGVNKGKGNYRYFTDRLDYAKYMQKQFSSNHQILDGLGKQITPEVFTSILMKYEDYVYEMDEIINGFKIDPTLLEILLSNYILESKFSVIQQSLIDKYRFINKENIVMDNGTIKIKGLINDQVQTVFFNDRFISRCSRILPYIDMALKENCTKFILDGQPTGLYNLVLASSSGGNVHRYKGLGEMASSQLAESTMLPDNRTLVQYTSEDIISDMKIIREYNSNKKLILDKIESISRSDLIG